MEIKFLSSANEFIRLNTPTFGYYTIDDSNLFYPKHLKLNTTYYKLSTDRLVAFRILAVACICENGKRVSFLVEMPNKKPRWITEFITTSSIILSHRDNYYSYIGGNKSVNINNVDNAEWVKISKLAYENSICDRHGNIVRSWVFDEQSQQVCCVRTCINYILINEDGFYINLSTKNGFRSKEECLRYKLDGFIIEDFEEDETQLEFEIKVSIKPSKPIIRTIHIIEE